MVFLVKKGVNIEDLNFKKVEKDFNKIFHKAEIIVMD